MAPPVVPELVADDPTPSELVACPAAEPEDDPPDVEDANGNVTTDPPWEAVPAVPAGDDDWVGTDAVDALAPGNTAPTERFEVDGRPAVAAVPIPGEELKGMLRPGTWIDCGFEIWTRLARLGGRRGSWFGEGGGLFGSEGGASDVVFGKEGGLLVPTGAAPVLAPAAWEAAPDGPPELAANPTQLVLPPGVVPEAPPPAKP